MSSRKTKTPQEALADFGHHGEEGLGPVGGRVPRSVLVRCSISNQVLPAPNERAWPAPKAVRRHRFAVGAFTSMTPSPFFSSDTSNRAGVRDDRRVPELGHARDGHSRMFLLDHSDTDQHLLVTGRGLLTAEPVGRQGLTLPARDAAVLRHR